MLRGVLVVLLGVALVSMASPSRPFAAPLAAQTSDSAGVRVVVTPQSPSANMWEFAVIMDTHTKPLTVDLTRATVLIDDAARRHVPTAWEGDAPGGHHRKGLLRFDSVPAATKFLELQIEGIGGAGVRTFRWELK